MNSNPDPNKCKMLQNKKNRLSKDEPTFILIFSQRSGQNKM